MKELETDTFQTQAEELWTTSNIVGKTMQTGADIHPDEGQTLQNDARTQQNHPQTGTQIAILEPQTHLNIVNSTAAGGFLLQEKQLNTVEKAEKIAKTKVFPATYGFMLEYRRLLVELQRCIHQERKVWLHVVHGKYLFQLENLKKQAQSHCREHGVGYENLLLSGVLEACERYLRNVLRTAPAVSTYIGLSYTRFPLDMDLVSLCRSAQQADFGIAMVYWRLFQCNSHYLT